jgi:hypothetical protein
MALQKYFETHDRSDTNTSAARRERTCPLDPERMTTNTRFALSSVGRGADNPLKTTARTITKRCRTANYSHDAEIITYCSCPNEESAALTALHLKRAGFKRIRPPLGGIEARTNAGRTIETVSAQTSRARAPLSTAIRVSRRESSGPGFRKEQRSRESELLNRLDRQCVDPLPVVSCYTAGNKLF